ncbi:MAG TPA: topoisomerase C-terminal repeat-containing protein, partial [Microvirga sp.]|nr:topoisomerase C-terminal repeat-containing protein [Microvirga sp.]
GRPLGDDPESGKPIVVKAGRFGPYVTDGETNATLPRTMTAEAVTLEEAIELLKARRAAGPSKKSARGRKAPAKKAAATKKAPAKKAATKTAAKKTAAKKPAAKKATAKKVAKAAE